MKALLAGALRPEGSTQISCGPIILAMLDRTSVMAILLRCCFFPIVEERPVLARRGVSGVETLDCGQRWCNYAKVGSGSHASARLCD
jgi:hypothetical protein